MGQAPTSVLQRQAAGWPHGYSNHLVTKKVTGVIPAMAHMSIKLSRSQSLSFAEMGSECQLNAKCANDMLGGKRAFIMHVPLHMQPLNSSVSTSVLHLSSYEIDGESGLVLLHRYPVFRSLHHIIVYILHGQAKSNVFNWTLKLCH